MKYWQGPATCTYESDRARSGSFDTRSASPPLPTGAVVQDTAKRTFRGGMLARLSLEHKIPLVIGSLLLVVILLLSVAAVLEVRGAAQRVAAERLMSVTQQFAASFQQSGALFRAQVAATASNPALAAFSTSSDTAAHAAVRVALAYHGPQPEQVVAIELRDSSGRRLLSTAAEAD